MNVRVRTRATRIHWVQSALAYRVTLIYLLISLVAIILIATID